MHDSNINLVKMLKDCELYNWEMLNANATSQNNVQQTNHDSQIQFSKLCARLKHMVLTTKRRQTMEAESLFVCQVIPKFSAYVRYTELKSNEGF